jgi:hypothetical protein
MTTITPFRKEEVEDLLCTLAADLLSNPKAITTTIGRVEVTRLLTTMIRLYQIEDAHNMTKRAKS